MSGSNFTMIRPLDIINALFTSSTITEADYGAYNAGTTYALGERVILVNPSSTVTITVAAPGVVTWTAHGQPVGAKIVLSTTGALPPGLTAGTIYHIVAVAADTFKLSETAGGQPIITTGTQSGTHTATTELHKIYESLQAGNIGHYPTLAASSTWWLDVGATNRWKMFDTAYNSQSEKADTIVVVLTPGEVVNSVALLNLEAASVTVAQTVSGFTRTITLNSHPVLNWYDWYYEELIRESEAVFTNVPPYATGVLTITIDNTGGTAKIGVLIIGKARELGSTQWEPTRTINDYSVTDEDAFGNVTLVQRSYSKRLNVEFRVADGAESEVTRLLQEFRATPMVFVGSEDYSMTIIYGFLGAWEVPISITGKNANLTIKGLI